MCVYVCVCVCLHVCQSACLHVRLSTCVWYDMLRMLWNDEKVYQNKLGMLIFFPFDLFTTLKGHLFKIFVCTISNSRMKIFFHFSIIFIHMWMSYASYMVKGALFVTFWNISRTNQFKEKFEPDSWSSRQYNHFELSCYHIQWLLKKVIFLPFDLYLT